MRKLYSAVLVIIFTFSGVYFFTACDETNSNNALEVEYSIEAVNTAILEATKNHSPSSIKVNQYVKYEDNYQIELTEPKISGLFENEVLEVLEDENQYVVTLQATETKYDEDGNTTENISEQKVKIQKYNDQEIINNEHSNLSSLKGAFLNGLLKSKFSLQNNSELGIFNLSVDSTFLPYPNSIQKRMGCDSANPCQFAGTRIKFLVHEYVNKTDPVKFSVDRIYMDNGSFINGTFSSCISRFFEAPERDYYIKQCSVLRDYEGI